MALTILAAYDVRVDASRARLAALLQAYGDRIQKSVFILTLDQQELDIVTQRASDIIDVDTDSLWLLRQCVDCFDKAATLGQTEPAQPVLYWVAY